MLSLRNNILFRNWLLQEQNEPHISLLLRWLDEKRQFISWAALQKGDTEFEKGRYNGLTEIYETLTTVMADTGTETAGADTGTGTVDEG